MQAEITAVVEAFELLRKKMRGDVKGQELAAFAGVDRAVAALRAAGSAEPEKCPTCGQTNTYYWHAAPLRLCSDGYHARPAPVESARKVLVAALKIVGEPASGHRMMSSRREAMALYKLLQQAIAGLSPTPLPQAAEKVAETVGDPQEPDGYFLVSGGIKHGEYRAAYFHPEADFQKRVQGWMKQCFSMEICRDRQELNHRFLEEALELVQACGCTASEAHQLVDYVYGRDQGEINQEVGGVMVTLAALCLANDIDMHEGGEVELTRILKPETMAKIQAKYAAKPKHSPLPR